MGTQAEPWERVGRIKEGLVLLAGEDTWCKKQVCECDKAAAICLRDSLHTYNKEYQFYRDSNCKEGPKKCEVSAGQETPPPQITQS